MEKNYLSRYVKKDYIIVIYKHIRRFFYTNVMPFGIGLWVCQCDWLIDRYRHIRRALIREDLNLLLSDITMACTYLRE